MADDDNSPFERYFRTTDDDHAIHQPVPSGSYQVPFQMPQFMHSGPPTLAPGGGAEVLPTGMLGDPYMMQQWVMNNGFQMPSLQYQPSGSRCVLCAIYQRLLLG
jgi:hypothetical protein